MKGQFTSSMSSSSFYRQRRCYLTQQAHHQPNLRADIEYLGEEEFLNFFEVKLA